jgi:RNA 3'-terminal phosphate cyclase (ATP)
MALAGGTSELRTARVTRHLLTNAHVIRRFITADVEIDGQEGKAAAVRVRGVGFGG